MVLNHGAYISKNIVLIDFSNEFYTTYEKPPFRLIPLCSQYDLWKESNSFDFPDIDERSLFFLGEDNSALVSKWIAYGFEFKFDIFYLNNSSEPFLIRFGIEDLSTNLTDVKGGGYIAITENKISIYTTTSSGVACETASFDYNSTYFNIRAYAGIIDFYDEQGNLVYEYKSYTVGSDGHYNLNGFNEGKIVLYAQKGCCVELRNLIVQDLYFFDDVNEDFIFG